MVDGCATGVLGGLTIPKYPGGWKNQLPMSHMAARAVLRGPDQRVAGLQVPDADDQDGEGESGASLPGDALL